MNFSKTARRISSLALTLTLVAGCSVAPPTDSTEEGLGGFLPRKSLRIAVVGAGPSGLTAADTLKSLGYQNVTVFEKNARVGGKVYSYKSAQGINELGAVFASPDYTLVLGLANKYGIPYVPYVTNQTILDENGVRQTQESFLTSHYSTVQTLAATVAYGAAMVASVCLNIPGFAALLPDLTLPMDQFAAKYGFTPISELARSVMIGFGYGYYETASAAYFMKLLPWLVKIGGSKGLAPVQYYTFPTGYQSIWDAVAAQLNVKLNSEVTSIVRHPAGSPSRATLTINGTQQLEFDAVIISAPLNRVSNFMSLTNDEQALFSQVQTERYLVTLFGATGLVPEEVLFFHNFARPSGINHANVWANRDKTSPAFVGYQIANVGDTQAQISNTLAQDVAGQGGTYLGTFLQQDWQDYFPHVSPEAMRAGFYDHVEALQGRNNTFYVGGTLSFETVEHSARYAQALVLKNFLPALF